MAITSLTQHLTAPARVVYEWFHATIHAGNVWKSVTEKVHEGLIQPLGHIVQPRVTHFAKMSRARQFAWTAGAGVLLCVVLKLVLRRNSTNGFPAKQTQTDSTKIIVVLGHPGSGKGTFAQSLEGKNLVHLSLGDFLRNEFRNQSDIGLRWKEEIRRFGILAIGVVKEVTTNLIHKINSSAPQTYILDGHIRTLEQAKHLDGLLNGNMNIYSTFIYINTDKNEALRRILNRRTCEKCNYIYNLVSLPPKNKDMCDYCDGSLVRRDTDNEVDASNRIDTYARHLLETITYYKSTNRLIEFNGNLPIRACVTQYRDLLCGSDPSRTGSGSGKS